LEDNKQFLSGAKFCIVEIVILWKRENWDIELKLSEQQKRPKESMRIL